MGSQCDGKTDGREAKKATQFGGDKRREMCLAQDREDVRVTPQNFYSVTQEMGKPERRE